MSNKIGPVYARQDYAGFIRRTLALALDSLLFFLVYPAVAFAWHSLAPQSWQTEQADGVILASLVLTWWIYMLGMRLMMKGTLGYRIMRIRYAYMFDGEPTLLAVMFRAVVATALMIVFVTVDHLWIIGDKRKQALHDKLSGFYVVKTRAQPVGTTKVVQRLSTIMGMSFILWEPASDDTPPPMARPLGPVAPPVASPPGMRGHGQA